MANEKGSPADGKRFKIQKAQRMTMLEVLGASLVVGVCIVLVIFAIKYIRFNMTIITEKNNAISEYEQSLVNIGICTDTDNNGRLSDRELNNCRTSVSLSSNTRNTLSYKILGELASNESLESVARNRDEDACFDDNKNLIDYSALYEQATSDYDRSRYLALEKTCSALRVIPDTLPSVLNTEALMASANEVFRVTGVDPTRLAPSDDKVKSTIAGTGVIPLTLRLESDVTSVVRLIDNLEKSIRAFDIQTGNFEYGADGLNFQASAYAYYMENAGSLETEKTLYATRKARANK